MASVIEESNGLRIKIEIERKAAWIDYLTEETLKGTGMTFMFAANGKYMGKWAALVQDKLAVTTDLKVQKSMRGMKFGEKIVFFVLNYLHRNGVREVRSM